MISIFVAFKYVRWFTIREPLANHSWTTSEPFVNHLSLMTSSDAETNFKPIIIIIIIYEVYHMRGGMAHDVASFLESVSVSKHDSRGGKKWFK